VKSSLSNERTEYEFPEDAGVSLGRESELSQLFAKPLRGAKAVLTAGWNFLVKNNCPPRIGRAVEDFN
jgi:hypothetical protein